MTAIRDDLDNSAIIGVGVGLSFLVAFLILALNAWFLKVDQEMADEKATTPASLSEYRAQQTERLNGYAWMDQEKNQVRIPIERAMALTVSKLSEGRPASEPEQREVPLPAKTHGPTPHLDDPDADHGPTPHLDDE